MLKQIHAGYFVQSHSHIFMNTGSHTSDGKNRPKDCLGKLWQTDLGGMLLCLGCFGLREGSTCTEAWKQWFWWAVIRQGEAHPLHLMLTQACLRLKTTKWVKRLSIILSAMLLCIMPGNIFQRMFPPKPVAGSLLLVNIQNWFEVKTKLRLSFNTKEILNPGLIAYHQWDDLKTPFFLAATLGLLGKFIRDDHPFPQGMTWRHLFFWQLHSDFRETTQSLRPEDILLAAAFWLQENSTKDDLKPPFWQLHSDFRETTQWPEDTLLAAAFWLQGNNTMTWSHPSGSCILTSGKQHNDLKPPFWQLHSDFRETTQWPEDTLLAAAFWLQGNNTMTWSHPSGSCILTSGKQHNDLKPPFWQLHSDFRETTQWPEATLLAAAFWLQGNNTMTWSHPSGSCILTSGKQHNDLKPPFWQLHSDFRETTQWPEATLLAAAFWLQGNNTMTWSHPSGSCILTSGKQHNDLKTPFWQLHSNFRETELRMTWSHPCGSCILTSGKQHNDDLKPPFSQLHSDFRETALRMAWSPVPDDGTLTSSCSMREMLGIVPSRFTFTSILEKVRSPMTTSCGRCPRMMLRNSWWRRYRSFHCFFSRAYVSAGTDFLQGLEDKSVGEAHRNGRVIVEWNVVKECSETACI